MERKEIINHVIKKYGYKTYLEIGVAIPTMNYDLIECEHKEGCDPYTDDTFDFHYYGEEFAEECYKRITYRMTSDEMFASMAPEKKFDFIFIDGLHTEEQVKKDILNSLDHLNPGGTIAVHDTIPHAELFAREERVTDEWYGCVYRAILDFDKIGGRYASVRQENKNGVTLIPYQTIYKWQRAEFMKKSTFTYADYESDTDNRMHIVSLEDFGKSVMIYHNSEYLNKPENRHFGSDGSLIFGGTESWVVGVAERLSKWAYDVTLFTDTLLGGILDITRYRQRTSPDVYNHFDVAIVTTNIEITKDLHCDKIILIPTCEFFNTEFGAFAPADRVGILSEWQREWYHKTYSISQGIMFRHFLPSEHNLYDNYKDYKKKNAMVWSSAPVRGLRFFVERVFPKIKAEIPDFELYICGYNEAYYEKEWAKYVDGVHPMINASHGELAELQKQAKIWVYPNIGRSETSGFFYETFCITAVENALAGNAIVCFDKKDGISSTIEGYDGFLDGDMFNTNDRNFMLHYEEAANILAERAISILKDDELRKHLSDTVRKICERYTWDNEMEIIRKEIS